MLPTLCIQLLGRVQLFATPWTVTHQAPLSKGFSEQEYWSGLPFPSPGNLPDLGNEPESPALPALVGRFFTSEPPGKPHQHWLPSPINRNWLKAKQEIQARLYWGPCCSRGERERTTIFLACLLPEGVANLFLIGWGYGCVQGSGQRDGLSVSCTP